MPLSTISHDGTSMVRITSIILDRYTRYDAQTRYAAVVVAGKASIYGQVFYMALNIFCKNAAYIAQKDRLKQDRDNL